MHGILIKRGHLDTDTQREDHLKTLKEMATYKPRREVSENNLAHPLILDVSFQNCEKVHFCCLSHLLSGTLLRQPKQTNTIGLKGNRIWSPSYVCIYMHLPDSILHGRWAVISEQLSHSEWVHFSETHTWSWVGGNTAGSLCADSCITPCPHWKDPAGPVDLFRVNQYSVRGYYRSNSE